MCETKYCCRCGQDKPTTEFSKDRTRKDGFQCYCKACNKAWVENNKKQHAASCKAWVENNRERHMASCRAWQKANPEKQAANCKAWQQKNPENIQAYTAKKRATKLGIDGPHFTPEEWKTKLDAHNRTCYYCGVEEFELEDRLQVDHVIPLSDPNSSNSIDNVVPCCKSCNSRKHNKPVEVFIAELNKNN